MNDVEEKIYMSDRLDRAYEFDDTDYEAERLAESAWLRYAENLGWEEAYMESLIESGLISRY